MAGSAGYEWVRKAGDGHAAVPGAAERPADARAGRLRRPGGLLRPSRVPVPGEEKGEEENERPTRRKSARMAKKEDLSTKATLSFGSSYDGVSRQKLAGRKNIMFGQEATLAIPGGQQRPIAGYYEFRQLVKDKFETAVPPGGNDATADWVQDGPYQPGYDNEEITTGRNSIRFHDVPGFSTSTAIQAGQWLSSYDVYFKWQVTAKYGGRPVWESPEVHHHADAPYDNGQDQGVWR